MQFRIVAKKKSAEKVANARVSASKSLFGARQIVRHGAELQQEEIARCFGKPIIIVGHRSGPGLPISV